MSSTSSQPEDTNGSSAKIEDKSQPEVEVIDGSDEKENSGGGFFGVFRKSPTNNITTRKNASRKSSSNKLSTSEDKMQQRKIVKGVQPPSGDDTSPSTDAAKDEVIDDKDIDRDAKRFALPGNAPSVENQMQQSMSEKTKKERMDTAASMKGEKKAKQLEEKRKTAAPSSDKNLRGVEGEGKSSTTTTVKPKDSIFSVESERADQKRTVGGAALNVDAEPVEKKMKVDVSDEEDDTTGKSSVVKSWLGGVKLVAVAAVVAVGALVLIRAARKK